MVFNVFHWLIYKCRIYFEIYLICMLIKVNGLLLRTRNRRKLNLPKNQKKSHRPLNNKRQKTSQKKLNRNLLNQLSLQLQWFQQTLKTTVNCFVYCTFIGVEIVERFLNSNFRLGYCKREKIREKKGSTRARNCTCSFGRASSFCTTRSSCDYSCAYQNCRRSTSLKEHR